MISGRNRFNFLIIACCFFWIASCTVTHYFKTPNDVYKTAATVMLEDGTERNGMITILFENGIDMRNELVRFIPTDSTSEQAINITKIQFYTVNGSSYFPKHLDLNTAGTNHLLFVKRLSAADSKIQFFELQQKFKSSTAGEETTSYFISLPGFDKYETIELNSELLVPNFDIKMSEMVADCPDLAQKIRTKKQGYTYSLISFGPKKLEVMKRIINEYNSCK